MRITMRRKDIMLEGLRDGLPIGLGYLAVSFSLGIAARNAGLSVWQGMLASFFTNASAGEYAVFALIKINAPLLEIAVLTLITNARYLLQSMALCQKMDPKLTLGHRLGIGSDITDELFALAIAREGSINPFYAYGAMIATVPFWTLGTGLGIWFGEILPARLLSAFSVALYGMFIAVIIPPARKNQAVAVAIMFSFVLSAFLRYWPFFDLISDGFKTIILTLVIASAAALIAPVKSEKEAVI